MFIHKVDVQEPTTALFAMEEENRHFIAAVCYYMLKCFEADDKFKKQIKLNKKLFEQDLPKKYEYLKFLYGEIHSYYIQLQETTRNKEDSEKADRLMSSVRNAMYAAKSSKDALPDTEQLRNSSNDTKFSFYEKTKEAVRKFCEAAQQLLIKEEPGSIERLSEIYRSVTTGYTETLQYLYKEGTAKHVNETEITTLLNFNREIFTGFKSLVFALKDHLYDREQSKELDELPGFIR